MSKGPMHALARFIRKVAFADAVGVSDAQLLHAYTATGDQEAFAALVKRHGPMVLGICSRLLRNASDAEDAFQATFLVLVRKARRIMRPKLLANWLYGVARRTAMRARAKAARRAHHETEAAMRDPESAGTDPAVASLWSDLRPILDEEIAHLPERFRVPVILCYLEGRTNEEAAKIIGCPKGTVLSRLHLARERLRKRLMRRGIAPPAALLTATLTSSALRAAVSPALVQTSVSAALAFAAGAPPVSLAAATLAKGVIANMFWTKILHVAILASGLTLVGGAGMAAWALANDPDERSPGPDAAKVAQAETRTSSAAAVQKTTPMSAEVNRKKLNEPMPFALEEAMNMNEAIKLLEKAGFPRILINENSFKMDNPDAAPIADTQIRMQNVQGVSKVRVLRMILDQIPTNNGAFLVRPDFIEVLTNEESRPERQFIEANFRNIPLEDALAELADQSGISIVIDGRVGDKARTPVTARFQHESNLVTAVRLLADMAELKITVVDRAIYVTPKSNNVEFPPAPLPAGKQMRIEAA